MTSLVERIRRLLGLPRSRHAPVLRVALAHALPHEVAPIADALLDHPDAQDLRAVLHRLGDLPPDLAHKAVLAAADLPEAVVFLTSDREPSVRLAALELIAREHLFPAAEALVERLEDSDESCARVAAAALRRLAQRAASLPVDAIRPAHRGLLDQAVADAFDRYPRHGRAEVLLAAALLSIRPGPRLAESLDRPEHVGRRDMRVLLARLEPDVIDEHAIEWLALEPLARPILDEITRIGRTPRFAATLQSSHLMLLPTIARRLARLDRRQPPAPKGQDLWRLDPSARRRLPAWINAIPMPTAERVERLGEFAADDESAPRLAALRALLDIPHPLARSQLETFAFDPDESIARLALRALLQSPGGATPQFLQRLLASPHPSVRTLAGARLPIADFQAVWTAWTDGREAAARVAARAQLGLQPHAFLAQLRRRLAEDDDASRAAAIRLAVALDLAGEVELELLAAARHGGARLVATAARALQYLPSAPAAHALAALLKHRDARVRANALESLAARRDAPLPIDLKQAGLDEANRPRANAIRALLDRDRAGGLLLLWRMLDDDRAAHRRSALWIVERAAVPEAARQVARLAAADPVHLVRQRARRTARRLLAAMNNPSAALEEPDRLEHVHSTHAQATP